MEEVEEPHFRLTRKKTMKQFECEYMSGDGNDKKVTILADTDEEAYAEFIAQEGLKPYKVYVGWGGVLGSGATFGGHVDQARQNMPTSDDIQQLKEADKVKRHANENALKSLSSTDILLKQLIDQQKEIHQVLLKIRWSLLVISIIAVLFYAFGWVIRIK